VGVGGGGGEEKRRERKGRKRVREGVKEEREWDGRIVGRTSEKEQGRRSTGEQGGTGRVSSSTARTRKNSD